MRPFATVDELARRVPALFRANLTTLAEVGALNPLGGHCRDALWQGEWAAREAALPEVLDAEPGSPLKPMNPEERLIADHTGTGVAVGATPWPTAGRSCA